MKGRVTLATLRRGEVIEIEGIRLRMDEGDIELGDLYVAERNTGPHLLTAERVVGPGEGPDGYGGWICPTTMDYSFDTHECVRVREA